MTIEQILNAYDSDSYDEIVLDYEGQITRFKDQYELEDVYEEEARGKLKRRTLEITVR